MAQNFTEATLGANESSNGFVVVGKCDIWVSGLSAGTVKLQLKFPNETSWRDAPGEVYSVDVWKTIFVSEHGVKMRLTGVGNNAGVYVRIARFLNK